MIIQILCCHTIEHRYIYEVILGLTDHGLIVISPHHTEVAHQGL